MNRRERILRHIDVHRGPGLEVGPLDKPVVSNAEATVLYVDHASAEALRAKYAGDPNVNADAVVPIDVEWATGRLSEKLAGRGPIQWVVASHVIEHVPDPVGWLGQFAEVLAPGGILSLAVPDGRFCFDAKRRTTDVAELIAATLTGRTRPTVALTYDFWARMTAVNPDEVWKGSSSLDEPDHEALGIEKCRELLSTSEYQDIHCYVFTPQSFVTAFEILMRLDLVPWYSLKGLQPTVRGDLEFFVSLERLHPELDREERRRLQAASIVAARPSLVSADLPDRSDGHGGAPPGGLSPKELRMVEMKREALFRLRRTTTRLTRRSRPRDEGSVAPLLPRRHRSRRG